MSTAWSAPSAPEFNYGDSGGSPVVVACSRVSPEGTQVRAEIQISLTAIDDGKPLPTDDEFVSWQGGLLDALIGAGWELLSAKQTTTVVRTASTV
jgi:hypothetical protein